LNVGGGACGPGSCAETSVALKNSAATPINAKPIARHRAGKQKVSRCLESSSINSLDAKFALRV
jgi:hypothetical protein